MLRAKLFVDLHAVVRQAVRASVESYSIKRLEPFFGFRREKELQEVGAAKRALEAALELADEGTPPAIESEWQRVVEAYNRDDCFAAMKLRDWLEGLRARCTAQGMALERPPTQSGEPSEALAAGNEETRALRERLTQGIPTDPLARSAEEHARMLLAHLLDFHWREEKVAWWEYHRKRAMSEDELRDEPAGIAGLELVGTVGGDRVPIHRYSFPPQDVEVNVGAEIHLPESAGGIKLGTVEAIDPAAGTIDVKKMQRTADVHAKAVFAHDVVRTDNLEHALRQLGAWVADNGVDAAGAQRAARDLLLRYPPRLRP